jgi:hypothetical protein
MNLSRSLALVMLLSAPAALAHSAGTYAPRYQSASWEGGSDRREVRESVREVRDDRRDAERAHELLARYDRARDRRDYRDLRWLDQEALRLMDRELREAERELREARGEVRRSEAELDRSRYVERPTWGRGEGRGDVRDERRDLADDRRDLRNDRHDLRLVRSLYSEYTSLERRMDGRALWRKRSLLAEFAHYARREVRESHAELREDRNERREDGRRW